MQPVGHLSLGKAQIGPTERTLQPRLEDKDRGIIGVHGFRRIEMVERSESARKPRLAGRLDEAK